MIKLKNETAEFQEFGGTAFVIDGVIPDQVCRQVEIHQIVDDTAILKCIPGGGIMICKMNQLFESAHDCQEAIKLALLTKQKTYEDEISDMPSLIRFMLKYDISPSLPTRDRLARKIAIEKAKAFGIDLTDITR